MVLHTEKDIQNCIEFVEAYRKMENLDYQRGYDLIRKIFKAEPEWKIEHICDHWKGKQRNFGEWFLNLDATGKIAVYRYFGIEDEEDLLYLEKAKENEMAVMFMKQSNTYARLDNLLRFFYNHAIWEKPAKFLELTNLPPKEARYGDARNWGKYIFSLSPEEQTRIVQAILENYQVEHYTLL